MKLTGIELRRISLPLVAPFRTSFGVATEREVLLLRAVTGEAEGWSDSIGIGFAVPMKTVAGVVDQLQKFGELRRGWLGVSIQNVTDEIAESLNIKPAAA